MSRLNLIHQSIRQLCRLQNKRSLKRWWSKTFTRTILTRPCGILIGYTGRINGFTYIQNIYDLANCFSKYTFRMLCKLGETLCGQHHQLKKWDSASKSLCTWWTSNKLLRVACLWGLSGPLFLCTILHISIYYFFEFNSCKCFIHKRFSCILSENHFYRQIAYFLSNIPYA